MRQDLPVIASTFAPLNRAEIARHLPHSGRMCLLEAALACDATAITCTASNHHDIDHPLRRDGRLPITAGIEYAAQAMALHATLTRQVVAAPNTRAMLVQLANISWTRDSFDECAGPLLIQAQQISALGNAANYHFSVSNDGAHLIEGNILVHFDKSVVTASVTPIEKT